MKASTSDLKRTYTSLQEILKKSDRLDVLDDDTYYHRFKREVGSLEISGKDKYLLYLYNNGIKVRNKSNSLVAWIMGITDDFPDDEIEYKGGLFPDIDIDIQDTKRKDVINYIKTRYGADKVSGIGTFGYMQSKGAIRNIGRALGYQYGMVDNIAKLIPDPIQGKNMDIDDALKEVNALKKMYESDKSVKEIIDKAKKAEGLILNRSQHAAGVIVSSIKLENAISTFRNDDDFPVSELGKDEVEQLGLIKMDILGLRTLSIISTCIGIINKRHKNANISFNNIPLDDSKTFELFRTKKLGGVFQFGSAGLSDFAAEFKPESLEHITLLTSFFRPGPIQYKNDLLDVRNGLKEPNYVSDVIANILEPTYGFIVYQEQLMKIVQVYAGYTEHEADLFRKAVAKKIESKMMAEKDKFLSRANEIGRNKAEAEKIWKAMEPFMNYGFNKSHALAYSMLTVKTAWLKTYYPVEFYAANIIHDVGDSDKISDLIQEAKFFGIDVSVPNINLSMESFSVINDSKILFGFDAVNKVGKKFARSIIKERNSNGEFKGLADFIKRMIPYGAKSNSIKNLILAGAFDDFGSRKAMAENVENIMEAIREAEKRGIDISSQDDISFKIDDRDEYDLLTKMQYESDILGISVSEDPLTLIVDNYRGRHSREYLEKHLAIVNAVKVTKTKKGQVMAFLSVKHIGNRVERLIVFPRVYNKYIELIRRNSIILYDGKKDSDGTIVNKMEKPDTIIEHTDNVVKLNFDSIPDAFRYATGVKDNATTKYEINIASKIIMARY